MKFFILGNPENRRVQHFSESLTTSGYNAPIVLSYSDVLKNNGLENVDFSGSVLRIESPGENFEVRKHLIIKGSGEEVLQLKEQAGEIIYTRQWYLGFKALLDDIQQKLENYPDCKIMNSPADIALMFDKVNCQKFLKERNIPVPDFYTSVTDYGHLLETMKTHKLNKVFIKPSHASSASGVIAFRLFGQKQQAITTIEIKKEGDVVQFFNSLKLKTYTSQKEIELIINKILKENALVETWLNKATIKDHFFDFRVLVIKGLARHMVVRMSKNVITNLHLGNKRGTINDLEDEIGRDKIDEVKQLAEKTAACFPESLYCGIDILIGSDKKEIKVLEVNAFGDLLPNVLHKEQTCYEAEIEAMLN